MLTFVHDLTIGVYFLLRGIIDALTGKARRRYTTTVRVSAPAELVWAVASARKIKFNHEPSLEISVEPRRDGSGIIEGELIVGEFALPFAYREVSRMEGSALLLELVQEATAPEIALGDDYFVAFEVTPADDGADLTIAHQLTHATFWSRVLLPVGLRQSARRLKRHCEIEAGTDSTQQKPIENAVVTGLLTFASFLAFVDMTGAAMLIGIILIHEAGHAIAMRWVGQPVQGIYFVPFFGGVAVAAAPHATEGERGFVALMGPAFSMLTTGVFMLAWLDTQDPIMGQLALLSAILNGLNLAPVLPLDGGQVVDSLVSGSDPEVSTLVNMAGILAGLGTAVYFGSYIMTGLLVIAAAGVLGRTPAESQCPAISAEGRTWLFTGYVATLAFYVAIIATFIG